MPKQDEWVTNRSRRQKARMWVAAHTQWPAPCAARSSPDCKGMLQVLDPWVLGHRIDRQDRPDLMWEPGNWQVECRPCSNRAGAYAKVRGKSKRFSGENSVALGDTPKISPLFTNSNSAIKDSGGNSESIPRQWLRVPWVAPLVEGMGPHDVWPRLMTAPHPRAVGSYGPEAVRRIDERRAADPMVPEHEKRLRFFQRLIVHRAYEHDEDGQLVWGTVLQTTNRQVGKSVLVREISLDRGWFADRLGEQQMVVHVARDLSVAEEVQRPARVWARWMREQGDRRYKAIDTNGKAEVSAPGLRWVSRSEKGAYGWSASLAPADECWDIEPGTIHNALAPTMAARREPQLWLLSTSHESCTALFPEFRNRALAEIRAPSSLLLLEWSARPDADDADESGWRAASPWYDERRRALIAGNAGAHGFREQWLNIWPEGATRVAAVEPLIAEEAWALLASPPAEGPVAGAAVEASAGLAPVVAEARTLPDGSVSVSVRQADTIGQAAQWCRDAGVTAVVGKSLLHDPAWTGAQTEPKSQTTGSACGQLRQLVGEGAIRHDGGRLLADQVAGTMVAPTAAGLRVASQGRTDAVKAAVWAVEAARAVPDSPMIW